MLRLLCIAFCFAAAIHAAGVKPTWVGQDCFVVQDSAGKPVVTTDPPNAAVGYPISAIPAGVVTVSHPHGDHSYTAGVQGNFALVDGRAANLIERLSPKIAILMHYRTAMGGPVQLANAAEVAKPFTRIQRKPAAVALEKLKLPLGTEVWIMEPAPK
jgi:L-ascorbate metabolism protein UlaG (beta-lactamase superfamily)